MAQWAQWKHDPQRKKHPGKGNHGGPANQVLAALAAFHGLPAPADEDPTLPRSIENQGQEDVILGKICLAKELLDCVPDAGPAANTRYQGLKEDFVGFRGNIGRQMLFRGIEWA